MSNIKNLKLNGLYISCEMYNEISNKLSNLFINHTFMDYKDKLIQFSNLKTLCVENIFLSEVFNINNVDFSSLSNLENLSIELMSYKDYFFLNKILLSSYNLIEFKLINSIEGENDDDSDLFEDDIYNDEDNDEDEDDYEKYLKKNNKKLIDSISNLKNLQSLIILNYSDIYHISTFIKIFENYQFQQLKNLNINCLSLNQIQKFLEKNPNIEKIDLDIFPNKKKKIKEKFNFINNENIRLKTIFLNFKFNKYQLQNMGSLYINISILQVIKIKNMFICNSCFKIFIDKNISFDNLIEFELKNDIIDESKKEEKQNILIQFVDNFKNFKKLKIISILDRCIDINFVNDFIKKNTLNLTKLKLETKLENYDTDILNDYFIDLFPDLKFLEKLKISLENKERTNDYGN